MTTPTTPAIEELMAKDKSAHSKSERREVERVRFYFRDYAYHCDKPSVRDMSGSYVLASEYERLQAENCQLRDRAAAAEARAKEDSSARFAKWLSENLSWEDPDSGLTFYPTETGGIFAQTIDGADSWEADSLDGLIDLMDVAYAKWRRR